MKRLLYTKCQFAADSGYRAFPVVLCTFLFLFFTFFFISCNLFSTPVQPNYLKNIDEEIAWANAEHLTINVVVPPGWGASPQNGENRCLDAVRAERPRKGYPFNVEFTPDGSIGFVEWLAFNSNTFDLSEISGLPFEDAKALSFNVDEVEIIDGGKSNTGAMAAVVTVKISAPVNLITLIPFCSERPRVIQTLPPLINNGFFYTRGQEIKIWMDLGYTEDKTLDFGEDLICIYGQYISNGAAWDDPETPVNEEGDLTGTAPGTRTYFQKPEYNAQSKIIIIHANDTEPHESYYSPGNMIITVTVGTGLLGANEKGMMTPVVFSYHTNNEIVTRAYKANNVWAIHDPENDRRVESFFYQTAPSDRDRRLRKKNSQDYYDVSLYFSVSRSMGEIEDPEPDSLAIAQIYYADLTGTESAQSDMGMGVWIKETPHAIEPMENTANSAGSNYRLMNNQTNSLGVYYYKAVYRFSSDTANGIIRLAILPWRDTGNLGTRVLSDDWQTVVAEGGFVTVVLDDQAPGGGSLQLSGQSYKSTEDNNDIYNFTVYDRYLSMIPDFYGLEDNFATGGKLLSEANPNIPWTRDDQKNILWRWSILPGVLESGWLSMGTIPPPVNVYDGLGLSAVKIWDINVQFKDAVGNESEPKSMGKFRCTVPKSSLPVTDWALEYLEETGIYVSWNTPTNMDRVNIKWIDAGTGIKLDEYDVDGTGVKAITIDNVPEIDASQIHGGTASEVTKYIVEFRTYKGSVSAAEDMVSAEIWNIPGIKNSEANPVIKINQTNMEDVFASIRNSGLGPAYQSRQYLLEDHITLSGTWTPVGSSSDTNAFQGKFYGNGKTITFYGDFAAGLGNYGIFGCAQNAVIRDLVVEYANSVSVSAAAASNTGGIAGHITGNTSLINCIVWGGSGITIQHSGTSGHQYAGGMVGSMNETTSIINCLSAIDVFAENTGGGAYLHVGGLVGAAASSTTSIRQSFATGKITGESKSDQSTGGLAGVSYGSIIDCRATGDVDAYTSAGILRVGGLLGYGYTSSASISSTSLAAITDLAALTEYTHATGKVIAVNEDSGTAQSSGEIRAGGLVGYTQGSIDKCYATGIVYVESSGRHAVGGLVGGALYTGSTQDLMDTVKNSWATGDVEATGGVNEHFVGGLVGRATAAVSDCYATGDVEGTKTGIDIYALRVGGLVAYANGNAAIVNCYATGSVTADSGANQFWAGGLVGRTEASITGSHATGDVEATGIAGDHFVGGLVGESIGIINLCYAKGNINANGVALRAGGLVGQKTANITQSWAKGDVIATGVVDIAANIDAGGIAGVINLGIIRDCYALGNVTVDYNYSQYAHMAAGGIAGRLQNSSVYTSFSAGKIKIDSGTTYAARAGGILGIYEITSGSHIVTNSVALGESITATAGSAVPSANINAHRIGYVNMLISFYLNYALDTMETGTSTGGYGTVPFTNPVSGGTISNANGADVGNLLLKTAGFWTGTASGQMGFDPAIWDTTDVGTKGYPILLGFLPGIQ